MRNKGLVLVVVLAMATTGGWLAAGEYEDDREDIGEILAVFEVLTSDLKSPGEAVEAALAKVPGRCLELELGAVRVKGKPAVAWELEILGKDAIHDVYVDAKTGAILGTEKEGPEEEAAELAEMLARGTALSTVLGTLDKAVSGQVVKAELEEEHDVLVWEALVVHGGRMSEVVVSAKTGKILPGFDDDEDDDDEDEDDDEDDDDEDEDEDEDDDDDDEEHEDDDED
jgi:uncharacterized membrane protein YkoI